VPGAPGSVGAAPGAGQVTVTWTPVASTAAAPVTGYRVFVDGQFRMSVPGADTAQAIVTGLTNGVTYTFQVTAYGPGGESPVSAPAVATPRTVPGAPVGVTAAATLQSGQVQVSFSAPPSDGGSPVTGYTVTASPGGITA